MIQLDQTKLVGICAVNSVEYIEEIFKLVSNGKIAVPLRSEEDTQRIEATNLVDVVKPGANKGWFSPKYTPINENTIAQVSFTSGTEGSPKGVLISHRALNDTVERLVEFTGATDEISEYIGIPVYHSFGYGRCRLIGTLGGKGYIPNDGFSPKEISSLLKEKQINSLSAVPSLLRVLLEAKSIFSDERHHLKWIEIGSQPMSAEEKIELRDLFPNANITQHYGLTEASRSTLLRVDGSTVNILDSVGKATGTTELRIAENGTIQIKGEHLADSLLIDGQQKPICDENGWFATTDLGEIRNNHLYFLGRSDNVINIGGQKISAESIEQAILSKFELSGGVAATRMPNLNYGESILVAIEEHLDLDADQLLNFLNDFIASNGISAKNVIRVYELDKLPATDTGKIKRKELSNLAHSSQAGSNQECENSTDIASQISSLFRATSGHDVDSSCTINSLELDSISVVGLLIRLEKLIGHLPHNLRELTIEQILSLATSDSKNEEEDIDAFLEDYKNTIPGSQNINPPDISVWQLIKEDYVTHERDWTSQGFWAIFNHRFGNWRMSIRPKLIRFPLTIIYKIHLKMIQMLCGIKLDYTVKIGRRVKIEHFGGIIMGARYIGNDVTIRQNTTLGIKDLSNLQGKPVVEQGVNIGTGAVIVGDIRVGRYSVIGPNAVVDQDIPAFSTVNTSAPSISIQSPD